MKKINYDPTVVRLATHFFTQQSLSSGMYFLSPKGK